VIRNGGSRTELLIENEVPILRECDILGPSAVHTPAERVYLALQLMYVDEPARESHRESYRTLSAELFAAAPSCRECLDQIDAQVSAGRFYHALRTAQRLLEHERRVMSHVR
jgi:flagellar protein FlbT